jgi:DNA invertase Pin-like site-specific DNA recombinase
MAEMDDAGVALYSDQQAIDSTSPFGKAMMQMVCVFGELEREMIRARVVAGLNRVRKQGIKRLGRPAVGKKIEDTISQQLGAGHGILKVAALVGVGSGTVQRVKREMASRLAEAA